MTFFSRPPSFKDCNISLFGAEFYKPVGGVSSNFYRSHSTKVKEFEPNKFAKNNTTNLEFLNFNFNSEQLTAIKHSSRQENLHDNACVGLL